jgi:hypothetical protein
MAAQKQFVFGQWFFAKSTDERLLTEHPDEVSYRLNLRESNLRLATPLVAAGKTSQASRLHSLGPFQNVSIAEDEASA